MTTDDLWRVALIAAGNGVLILFFQALRKPPKEGAPIARPPAWMVNIWSRVRNRKT